MQSPAQHVAILFADICDSTPLYEEAGDASALAVIASRLDELADLATRFGGTVIRSKGDDVLCIFKSPTSAVDTGEAMIDRRVDGGPPIHVGIHFGPVIRARQDIYGDAVNVAARMLTLAKPGEVVASKELIEALPKEQRGRLALLGSRTLKGKQVPIDVYSMVGDVGDATQIVWGSGGQGADARARTIAASVVVELEHEGRIIAVPEGKRFLLGRAERCDLVVLGSSVSREHARIEINAGRAMLTDQSSTGTWILHGDNSHTTLRRESSALQRRGKIRLGRHPSDPHPAPELTFKLRDVL